MTTHHFTRARTLGWQWATILAVAACASSTPFERALDAHRWGDAATAFDADTSLLHQESTLFRAAMLYSFPDRDTYAPARARALFEQFLQRYPDSPRRQAAIGQLALLYEIQRLHDSSTVTVDALQAQIAQMAKDTLQIRARADSLAVRLQAEQDQSALLRKIANRLENDLQDRETQLRQLHDELDHLKAIDLKPPPRPKGGETHAREPM